MPEAHTPLIERLARVLAGFALSSNADGADASASGSVDDAWRDFRGAALAVIRELREPDPAMTAAGDATVWASMIQAALESADSARP